MFLELCSLVIQQARQQRILNPSLYCLSGLRIETQGRAREAPMLEKGVTVLHGQGREEYHRPSCTPNQASYHKSIESGGPIRRGRISCYLDGIFLFDPTLTVHIV